MNRDVLQIVYASDDRFAEILGVSLVSLYENNQEAEEIAVYILDSGISEQNKNRLHAVAQQFGRQKLCFISAKNINQVLSVQANTDRGSVSQYARLFLSGDLPQNLERVLYLDCDIIIHQSLHTLWNLNLQGNTIAALRDAFSRQYRKNIDLEPEDVMFNSGVMLIDLKKWKERHIEQKLMKFIKQKKGQIQQGDQGALNAVLSKETLCFDPCFNTVTIFFDFTYEEMLQYRKPVNPYSAQQIAEAVRNPVVIHFTTSFLSERPWIIGSKHPYTEEWLAYKQKSPWKEEPLWPKQARKGVGGLYVRLCSALPRSMVISVSGLLQAYGRPFFYSLKK